MSARVILAEILHLMRVPSLLALGVGCNSPQPAAPRPPDAPPVAQAAPAPGQVAAPSRPTPAFAPAQAGRCTNGYYLANDTCVHLAFQLMGEPLTRAIADYKRGVAPPMLGPVPAAANEPGPRGPLGPGALSKASEGDAGPPRERRLAELDAMIAVAQQKLRERDDASKAKRVEGPAPSASDAGARATSLVGGSPGAGAFEVTAPQDPGAARSAELSRLTGMLSSEQLQAMSGELSKMGIDPKQLDALIRQARGDVSQPEHTTAQGF